MKVNPVVGFPDEPVLTLAETTGGGGLGVMDRGDRSLDLADVGIFFHNDRMVPEGALMSAKRMVLNVTDGAAAGTHTASVTIPAEASIYQIRVFGVALWNQGTSALLDVGDATDPDGYFTQVDLKATDLLVNEIIDFVEQGGKGGAYIAGGDVQESQGFYSASARVITALLTTVGTAATTGKTVIDVYYFSPAGTKAVATTVYAAT